MTKAEKEKFDKLAAKADSSIYSKSRKESEDRQKRIDDLIALSRNNREKEKEKQKTKAEVDLPKYTRSPYANYKLLEGKVMDAHSDLKIKKNGKREISTKMKIWQQLTPRDKADLKRSIMLAIDHKFKGGSISDFPDDIKKTATAIHKYFEGKGISETGVMDANDYKNVGSTLAPQTSRNIESGIGGFKKNVMNLKAMADKLKARKGKGLVDNYFKPKGMRQLIYFSDSSSDEDEPHIPMKRGRGRPKCS